MFLTTDAIVVDAPKKESSTPDMGGMWWMWGMGGMM
jgi:hypothetical protein